MQDVWWIFKRFWTAWAFGIVLELLEPHHFATDKMSGGIFGDPSLFCHVVRDLNAAPISPHLMFGISAAHRWPLFLQYSFDVGSMMD
jgi:hypothetical protein